MLLRSKREPGTGIPNIHHFALPQPDGTPHRYDIGSAPIAVPDADALIILKLHTQVEEVSA